MISLSHQAWAGFARLPDGRVRAGAGLRLKELCGHAAKAGVGGLEFLEGIPGSVGGALRMLARECGHGLVELSETWVLTLVELGLSEWGVLLMCLIDALQDALCRYRLFCSTDDRW